MRNLGLFLLFVGAVSCSSIKKGFVSGKESGDELTVLQKTSAYLTRPPNFDIEKVIPKGKPWQWRGNFAVGSPQQSFQAPIHLGADDLLIVTLGGGLQRFDVRKGFTRWSVEMPIGAASIPAVSGSAVFVAGMDGLVRRLDLLTGNKQWESKISAESLGGIAAQGGMIYVNAADDTLWALDQKTGKHVWSYKRPGGQSNVFWSLRGQARPLLSGDGQRLYLGFSDGHFVALNSNNGETVWEREFESTGRFNDVDSSPVMSRDGKTIYLPVVNGELFALKSHDGSTVWKLPMTSVSSPLLDENEGVLYYSTRKSQLRKVNLKTGSILWSIELGKVGLASTPCSIGKSHLVLSTSHEGLLFLDKRSAKIVKRINFGYGPLAPPVTDGKRLFVISARNYFHLYYLKEET